MILKIAVTHHRDTEFTENKNLRVHLSLTQRVNGYTFQPNDFPLGSLCLCGELRFLG